MSKRKLDVISNLREFKRAMVKRMKARTDPATRMRDIPGETEAMREARCIVRVLMPTCPFDTGAAQWIERRKISDRQDALLQEGMEYWDAHEIARAEWLLGLQQISFKPFKPTTEPRKAKEPRPVKKVATRKPTKAKAAPRKGRRVQIEGDE